ncbi:unnamed protein product [Oikopleura dioica]|uniref:Uncharacterized protein n=1 Tax=Oikopleura dioica TaxID=34765 RepID=E4XWU8_OIKDI|nr:unnamed protein product [Oikopleura dioica]
MTHVLRTLAPLPLRNIATPERAFDLHVLSTPPAFVLSQNQTLRNVSDSISQKAKNYFRFAARGNPDAEVLVSVGSRPLPRPLRADRDPGAGGGSESADRARRDHISGSGQSHGCVASGGSGGHRGAGDDLRDRVRRDRSQRRQRRGPRWRRGGAAAGGVASGDGGRFAGCGSRGHRAAGVHADRPLERCPHRVARDPAFRHHARIDDRHPRAGFVAREQRTDRARSRGRCGGPIRGIAVGEGRDDRHLPGPGRRVHGAAEPNGFRALRPRDRGQRRSRAASRATGDAGQARGLRVERPDGGAGRPVRGGAHDHRGPECGRGHGARHDCRGGDWRGESFRRAGRHPGDGQWHPDRGGGQQHPRVAECGLQPAARAQGHDYRARGGLAGSPRTDFPLSQRRRALTVRVDRLTEYQQDIDFSPRAARQDLSGRWNVLQRGSPPPPPWRLSPGPPLPLRFSVLRREGLFLRPRRLRGFPSPGRTGKPPPFAAVSGQIPSVHGFDDQIALARCAFRGSRNRRGNGLRAPAPASVGRHPLRNSPVRAPEDLNQLPTPHGPRLVDPRFPVGPQQIGHDVHEGTWARAE